MPVSGLVLVCSDTAGAVRALRQRSCFTIGAEQGGGRVPVVLDTDTHAAHRAELTWLREAPGVSLVELAYADYREVDQATEEIVTDGR